MVRRSLRFNCFSPPVMVATFVIEISLLLYTLIRYKINAAARLTIALLFFLATFQLAEYVVCTGTDVGSEIWSRVGFVAITLLPALGLHLSLIIADRKWYTLRFLAYVNALGWIILFAFSQNTFSGHICQGNYVIFQLDPIVSSYYYFYYYGWLLITIVLNSYLYLKSKNKKIKEALMILAVGYLVFLLPTTFVNTLNPTTKDGVPSIMCGFAVLFALILVFGIMPLVSKARNKSKK